MLLKNHCPAGKRTQPLPRAPRTPCRAASLGLGMLLWASAVSELFTVPTQTCFPTCGPLPTLFLLKYVSLLPPLPFHHHLNWSALSSEKPSLKPWLGAAPPRTHVVRPPHHSPNFAQTGCEPMKELWVRPWKDGTWCPHSAPATMPGPPGHQLLPLPPPGRPSPQASRRGGYIRTHTWRAPASANELHCTWPVKPSQPWWEAVLAAASPLSYR